MWLSWFFRPSYCSDCNPFYSSSIIFLLHFQYLFFFSLSNVLHGLPGGARGKELACQCRRRKRCRFDPWIGKILWRRACNPLQHACLENPMDRRAWWATVHGVTQSQTWLKWLNTHRHTHSVPRVSFIYLFYSQPLLLESMPCGAKIFIYVPRTVFGMLECSINVNTSEWQMKSWIVYTHFSLNFIMFLL